MLLADDQWSSEVALIPELEPVISNHGLEGVFVGTILEGEGVLLAASVLAQRGLLSPVGVWLAATLGAWSGHMLWFGVGRRWGGCLLSRSQRLADAVDRADRTVDAHPRAAIFLLQYLYGVRMAGALAFGLTRLSWRRFALFQAANCLLWAALFTSAGYLLGAAAAGFLHGQVRWLWTAASLAVLVLVVRRLSASTFGAARKS